MQNQKRAIQQYKHFCTNRIFKSKLAQNLSIFKFPRFYYTSILYKTRVLKLFLLIISVILIIVMRVIQLSIYGNMLLSEYRVKEALANIAEDLIYVEEYRKKCHLSKDLKFILIWSYSRNYEPTIQLGSGQHAFIKNNCSVINCYATYDKQLFGDDVTKFDAIAFNGRVITNRPRYYIPRKRSPHQKYIYFNMESADNFPVCRSMFDGFFNWTATYKLNSDILFAYLHIKNRSGDIVGPKKNMQWDKNVSFNNDFSNLQNKSKAVAWLVSHCNATSGRDEIVKYLQKYLQRYNLTVDIYGLCGSYRCPEGFTDDCLEMLGRNYYFYLAFENSFAEDYVTEKLLTALNYNMIPIVYGGADYSRFLPPNSYLDALQMRPRELANTIARLISSPEQYSQYFSWKSQYQYTGPLFSDSVCALCAALNNKTIMETQTVYEDFRIWWYPIYKSQCKFT